MCKMEDNLLTM